MTDKIITELSLISAFTETCNIPVDDTVQTYRATGLQIYNYIKSLGMVDNYNAATTYSATDYCFYQGAFYKSLSAANVNNTPSSSYTKWILVYRDLALPYVGTNPEVGGASPFTMTIAHNRSQSINPAGDITILLPTTGVKSGETYTINNRAAHVVTVQSSGANAVCKLNACTGVFMSLQDTPTTAAHWETVEVKYGKCERVDAGAVVLSSTGNQPVKPNSMTVDKMYYERLGEMMHCHFDMITNATTATPGTGDYLFAIPTGFTINTAKAYSNTTTGSSEVDYPGVIGAANTALQGTSNSSGTVRVYDSTRVRIYSSGTGPNQCVGPGNNNNSMANNHVVVSADFIVPITEWALT
jgi:hypothetical protein